MEPEELARGKPGARSWRAYRTVCIEPTQVSCWSNMRSWLCMHSSGHSHRCNDISLVLIPVSLMVAVQAAWRVAASRVAWAGPAQAKSAQRCYKCNIPGHFARCCLKLALPKQRAECWRYLCGLPNRWSIMPCFSGHRYWPHACVPSALTQYEAEEAPPPPCLY